MKAILIVFGFITFGWPQLVPINLIPVPVSGEEPLETQQQQRTRAISLLFSFLQCSPNSSSNFLDADSKNVLKINQNYNPEDHRTEYKNITEVDNLIAFVKNLAATTGPSTTPLTTDPKTVKNLQIILVVLYRNSENWQLFYNTAAWLLWRVNSAQLYWSLMIVSAEKFTTTVTVPSTGEIVPQLFIPKDWVLNAAGLLKKEEINKNKTWYISSNPLWYWMGDPGLNEFHTHFHMDMPFWWNAKFYDGIFRYRKGELFLYMHHQLINRYNAERLSNWLPDVYPLGLDPEDRIPEGYWGDVVNMEYYEFPPRPDGWYMGDYDDGLDIRLEGLKQMYDRIWVGIDRGYFLDADGNHVSLKFENGSDILGATVEASDVYSANYAYYGSFSNLIKQFLAEMLRAKKPPVFGVEAHYETGMRDRVFYQAHKTVDTLYLKLKNDLTTPYKQEDLQFTDIAIIDLKILTCPWVDQSKGPTYGMNLTWPYNLEQPGPPTLTTYNQLETFDISTAARPCRSINDEAIHAQVETLANDPFTYVIAVQSLRPKAAYGMVRIFMWPQYRLDGSYIQGDDAHVRAIELDRFRVKFDPGKVTVITRSSLESSLTRLEPSPGIKKLYWIEEGDDLITNPEKRRACGFPNNLLLPKGTKDGLPFKLTVYISDETDDGNIDETKYPHYPLCGALNGRPFPDKRPMGFPFDRPGTSFNLVSDNPDVVTNLCGFTQMKITNVKQINVVIKHYDSKK